MNEGKTKTLKATTKVKIRFNEVDSLQIVWHGHYLKYFEDGREAFGDKYGITYLDLYEKEGFSIPIVKSSCKYKRPLRYGDTAVVEAEYIDTVAAKIRFEYKIYRESDNELVTTGETEQIFLDRNNELQLTLPDFLVAWKKRWGLI